VESVRVLRVRLLRRRGRAVLGHEISRVALHDRLHELGVLLRVHVVVEPWKTLAGKACDVFYGGLFRQERSYSFDNAIGFFQA